MDGHGHVLVLLLHGCDRVLGGWVLSLDVLFHGVLDRFYEGFEISWAVTVPHVCNLSTVFV